MGATARERPLIVAHRGAWNPAPQNSAEAFARAIALGCDGIELDVRRTADGVLAVVHDARVAGRLVAHQEHRRLQERMKPGQAPALADVLELAAGRILLDIELKEPRCVDTVMALVARRLEPEQYVITSFREHVVAAVKQQVPGARTGLLIGTRQRRRQLERCVRLTGVDFLAPNVALARRGLLAWADDHGLPAWVWTVNDSRALRRLSGDPRVGALITDRPAEALGLNGAVDSDDSRE